MNSACGFKNTGMTIRSKITGIVTLVNFCRILSRNLVVTQVVNLHESLPSVTCPEMNMQKHNVFVTAIVARGRSHCWRHLHYQPCKLMLKVNLHFRHLPDLPIPRRLLQCNPKVGVCRIFEVGQELTERWN